MAARITSDVSSPTSQASDTDQPVFMYDDPNAVQPEAEYVPEREFVLMPLFRHIGQMLGIYRPKESEYIYTPEPVTSEPKRFAQIQPEQPTTSSVQSLHTDEAGETPITARTATEDILGIDQQITSEPEIAESWAPEPEIVTAHTQEHPEPPSAVEQPLQEPVLLLAEVDQSKFEPAIMEEAISRQPASIAASAEVSQPVTPPPALTQQDANDLAAQIREAASRISTAVAQAAEWLHAKEEEILHRAGMPQQPIAQESQAPQQLERARVSSEEARAEVPEWEDKQEVPALQREVAWQEERPSSPDRAEATVLAASQPMRVEERERRLELVSKPAAFPFWKRIDWAQQFAPKRVAILGACVMAILIILGISLARRPAASVLPEQTRTIEPGGVTLSTHPATSPATPAQLQRKSSASRPAAPRAQARRAGSHDDGPEVVTHYYGKPKPSPSRQSTVAGGVRRYSDLQ